MSEIIRQRSISPRAKADIYQTLAVDPTCGVNAKIIGDARNKIVFVNNNIIDPNTGVKKEFEVRVPRGAVIVELTGTEDNIDIIREVAHLEETLNIQDNPTSKA